MRCEAKKADGGQCQAQAQAGSLFCFFHDVEVAAKRLDAQKRGGCGHVQDPAVLPVEVNLATPQDIQPVLAFVAKRVLERKLDAKSAHAVCHATYIALRAYELGIAQAQLDKIERLLEVERNTPRDRAEIPNLLHFEPREVDEIYDDLFPEPKKEAKINESPAGAGEEFPG